MEIPHWEDILRAHTRISSLVHRTPVLTSSAINRIAGCEIFFKCENFQKAGAFKFRGATNAVLSLGEEEVKNGVATHSSGNHAAALALAARSRGAKAYIVMPENAPSIKKEAVFSYGGEITFCEATLEARESALNRVVSETGATFIHPYNNFNVICGQATAAKELLEETGRLDLVMVPVGGGGLLSGTALSVKSMYPKTLVIAAEPENADDAFRSFKTGRLQPPLKPNTLADGLLTALGPLTFKIIMENVDDILLAGEEGIVNAMKLIWERMKIIVEPSSAVPLAAILENRSQISAGRIGIILTGGNVDLAKLPFK
ncbi:MAG: pyridoxal-phosphate dependent enzyme [Bacteroidales bacterium]